MTNFTVKNNVGSLVTNDPLSSSGTTLNISTGSGTDFPSTFPYRLTIWDGNTYTNPSDDSNMEIIECTGKSGDTLTIIRGKENTSGVEHTQNSYIIMLITAGIFNDSTYGINTQLEAIDIDENGNINELNKLIYKNPTQLTISGGIVTVTQTRHKIYTESGDATDDLDTINGGEEGQILIINASSSIRDVVVKHQTGNISLFDGADITLTTNKKMLFLIYNDSYWCTIK